MYVYKYAVHYVRFIFSVEQKNNKKKSEINTVHLTKKKEILFSV